MKKQDNAIVGIYKITSPSGKVYIGQSTDIYGRWERYKKYYCKRQPKLYYSLKKHGYELHVPEILIECSKEYLNELETFYKQQVIDEFGWGKALFCEIYDLGTGGHMSEETKQKISKGNIGKNYLKILRIK